jgi:hypothetical protein
VKNLGTKGQLSGITIGYSVVLFFVALLIIGFTLIVLSEDILGLRFNALATDGGADASILSYFEIMRNILPVAVILGLFIAMIVGAYLNR